MLTPARVNDICDARGWHDAVRGTACYALEVTIPDAPGTAWDAVHDTRPDEAFIERITAADTVLYVGASSDAYQRMCDHAKGEVRQAAFCAAFPPTDIYGLLARSDAHVFERRYAILLAGKPSIVTYTDGDLIG